MSNVANAPSAQEIELNTTEKNCFQSNLIILWLHNGRRSSVLIITVSCEIYNGLYHAPLHAQDARLSLPLDDIGDPGIRGAF